MARTLALPPRRFKLDMIGEGWQGCYIDYRPLVPRDLLALQDLRPDQMDGQEQTEYMIKLVTSHMVGGKVLLDGEGSVADIEPEDIAALPTDVLVELVAVLSGGAADPKDIPTVQAPSNVPSTGQNS